MGELVYLNDHRKCVLKQQQGNSTTFMMMPLVVEQMAAGQIRTMLIATSVPQWFLYKIQYEYPMLVYKVVEDGLAIKWPECKR